MANNGLIPHCATAGCARHLGEKRCCDFQQGNFIVLYPGELDRAQAEGRSTAHLKIIEVDDYGGQKAVCTASDTATCDNGFKPLDCKSYPFFPAAPGGRDVDLLIKGKKCPLQIEHLADHVAYVQDVWTTLIDLDPAIRAWLNNIVLVGYTEPLRPLSDLELAPLVIAA